MEGLENQVCLQKETSCTQTLFNQDINRVESTPFFSLGVFTLESLAEGNSGKFPCGFVEYGPIWIQEM